MNKMENSKNNQLNKKLMPIGFYDLIFAEAENNHRQVNDIIDYFMGQGYRLIKPSLVEFANQYLQDNKNSKSENLLYFTDLFSGEIWPLKVFASGKPCILYRSAKTKNLINADNFNYEDKDNFNYPGTFNVAGL